MAPYVFVYVTGEPQYTHFANKNKLHSSLMGCVICRFGCRNYRNKAECSKNGMFIDPHTQNSKNSLKKFRNARFSSKCEEIQNGRVRSNEEGQCT